MNLTNSSLKQPPIDLTGMGDEQFLTAPEYAQVRRTSPSQVAKERHFGVGCNFVKLGGRVFYKVQDVRAYFAAHRRTSTIDDGTLIDAEMPRGTLP